MINLMPTDAKKEIRAARINVILARYIVLAFLTFLFLLAVLGFGYYILTSVKIGAENVLQNNYTEVQASTDANSQVQQFQASLANANTVLTNDIDYPKVLERIAALLPDGVVIGSLTLSSNSFGTPTTLQALAKTNGGATDLQTKLQGSAFFTNVSLQSISTTNTDPAYPVTASFSLTINKGIAQ